jgi:hypothetical protein
MTRMNYEIVYDRDATIRPIRILKNKDDFRLHKYKHVKQNPSTS